MIALLSTESRSHPEVSGLRKIFPGEKFLKQDIISIDKMPFLHVTVIFNANDSAKKRRKKMKRCFREIAEHLIYKVIPPKDFAYDDMLPDAKFAVPSELPAIRRLAGKIAGSIMERKGLAAQETLGVIYAEKASADVVRAAMELCQSVKFFKAEVGTGKDRLEEQLLAEYGVAALRGDIHTIGAKNKLILCFDVPEEKMLNELGDGIFVDLSGDDFEGETLQIVRDFEYRFPPLFESALPRDTDRGKFLTVLLQLKPSLAEDVAARAVL